MENIHREGTAAEFLLPQRNFCRVHRRGQQDQQAGGLSGHHLKAFQFQTPGIRLFPAIGIGEAPGQPRALIRRHRDNAPRCELAMIGRAHGARNDMFDLRVGRSRRDHVARPTGTAGGEIGGETAEVVELLFGHPRHFGREGRDCKENCQ